MSRDWEVPSFEGKSYAFARNEAVKWRDRANWRLRRVDRNYRWWKIAIICYWGWCGGVLFPTHVWAAIQGPDHLVSTLTAAWMLCLIGITYMAAWRPNEKGHKRDVEKWMWFISAFDQIIGDLDKLIAKYGDDAVYGDEQ